MINEAPLARFKPLAEGLVRPLYADYAFGNIPDTIEFLLTGSRRGGQSVVNGVRASATTRPHGVAPQGTSLVQLQSPLSPQFGSQLPTPVRCSTPQWTVSLPLQRVFGFHRTLQ